MANEEEIKVIITGEDKASKVMDTIGGTAKTLAKTLGTLVVAGFAAVATEAVLSVKAFVEAERSTRQLNHAVIAVSKGTKEQVAEIEKLTKALQRKAGIDADALNAGVAQLSTFGLQTKSVIGLTKSLADLTVNQDGLNASSGAYITNANIIAKALRGEFGMLAKMGIRFTEAQQAVIKFGSEQQKVATIVEGFNQNLRETTDSIAPTYEAKIAILKQSFGELQETIGGAIVTAIIPFITKFSEWATSTEVEDKIQRIGEAVGKMMERLKEVPGSIKSNIDKFNEWFAVFSTQNPVMIALVGALKTAWDQIWKSIKEQLMPAFQEFAAMIEPHMPLLTELVKALATVFGGLLLGALLVVIKALAGLVALAVEFLAAGARIVTFLVDNWFKAFEKVRNIIAEVIQKINEMIASAKNIGKAFSGIGGAASSVGKAIGNFFIGKAAGGPVSGGSPYIVGERGPELFVPKSTGNIIPNNKLGMGGIVINITGTFLSQDAARAMANLMMQELKMELKV